MPNITCVHTPVQIFTINGHIITNESCCTYLPQLLISSIVTQIAHGLQTSPPTNPFKSPSSQHQTLPQSLCQALHKIKYNHGRIETVQCHEKGDCTAKGHDQIRRSEQHVPS